MVAISMGAALSSPGCRTTGSCSVPRGVAVSENLKATLSANWTAANEVACRYQLEWTGENSFWKLDAEESVTIAIRKKRGQRLFLDEYVHLPLGRDFEDCRPKSIAFFFTMHVPRDTSEIELCLGPLEVRQHIARALDSLKGWPSGKAELRPSIVTCGPTDAWIRYCRRFIAARPKAAPNVSRDLAWTVLLHAKISFWNVPQSRSRQAETPRFRHFITSDGQEFLAKHRGAIAAVGRALLEDPRGDRELDYERRRVGVMFALLTSDRGALPLVKAAAEFEKANGGHELGLFPAGTYASWGTDVLEKNKPVKWAKRQLIWSDDTLPPGFPNTFPYKKIPNWIVVAKGARPDESHRSPANDGHTDFPDRGAKHK